jgi:hypothetical protein
MGMNQSHEDRVTYDVRDQVMHCSEGSEIQEATAMHIVYDSDEKEKMHIVFW